MPQDNKKLPSKQTPAQKPAKIDEKRGGHQPNVPPANWSLKPPPTASAVQPAKKGK
jgi:hypothetical protein